MGIILPRASTEVEMSFWDTEGSTRKQDLVVDEKAATCCERGRPV